MAHLPWFFYVMFEWDRLVAGTERAVAKTSTPSLNRAHDKPYYARLQQRLCERKRSDPSCNAKEEWVASSQALLAMTL